MTACKATIDSLSVPLPMTVDLIALQTSENLDATAEANQWIRELGCEDGVIQTRFYRDLTLADVRGKVVCGDIPLAFAQHALLVITRESLVMPADVDTHSVGAELVALDYRLTAWRVHRAASQPAC